MELKRRGSVHRPLRRDIYLDVYGRGGPCRELDKLSIRSQLSPLPPHMNVSSVEKQIPSFDLQGSQRGEVEKFAGNVYDRIRMRTQ
jgi:hypothetical protein